MIDRLKTRLTLALCALALTAACVAPPEASRSVPPLGAGLVGVPLEVAAAEYPAAAPRWNVRDLAVTVPARLSVSEANLFYPLADIVWRGEPRGDRHAQVGAIVTEALALATEGMREGRAVRLEVEVLRFHSVTEKARFTFGGVHSIALALSLRDAESGEAIGPARRIAVAIPAAGGSRAIEEDSRGLTQRVVIVHNLAHVLRRELMRPPGAAEPVARLGGGWRLSPAALPGPMPVPVPVPGEGRQSPG
jgi:hypothetical protein